MLLELVKADGLNYWKIPRGRSRLPLGRIQGQNRRQRRSHINLESRSNSKSVALSKRRVSPNRTPIILDLRETLNAKQNQEGDLRDKLNNRTTSTSGEVITPVGLVARANHNYTTVNDLLDIFLVNPPKPKLASF
ncbi:hypothetical protein Acr_09g0003070 [Actinidia rufa]|uniref:Uncharacterized protein n=1 Tax=Actinidia rufa TaxID=165716 RepID=A0A7J0F5F3_9ERIC|nr:hypothetical protein Acr_09g0003070 [Actinidia rufa]